MRGGEQKQGYTIVEVMIFLAISGLMFVLAASFISGRQARNEFRQGMTDINSQIQQVINDVSNGFYPYNGSFSCSAGASGVPSVGAGASEQGGNKGCTFIGKVMQFGVNGAPATSYNVYTVVGRQFKPDVSGDAGTTLTPPMSFAEALPVAAAGGGAQDLTAVKNLKWGLTVDKMTNDGTDIGAFGFFGGFATSTDNNLDSGAAAPVAVVIPHSLLNQTTSVMESNIRDLASATVDTDPNIVMCFKGEARQYGRLTIGSTDGVQGQKLATHIQISNGAPSAGCPA